MINSMICLQKFIDKKLLHKEKVKILEAGCGSINHIALKQKTYISGIDISQNQLDRNIYLDEKILGDLQCYNFDPLNYDIVVCWDVLEHLKKPISAIEKMAQALKKNGLMILKFPNVLSLKGLITKYSPYKLHILYYKIIYKRKNGGRDDNGPFKTFMKYSIRPNSLKKYASSQGLNTIYFDNYDICESLNTPGRGYFVHLFLMTYKTLRKFFWLVSFGKLGKSELIIVLQK